MHNLHEMTDKVIDKVSDKVGPGGYGVGRVSNFSFSFLPLSGLTI